MLCYWPPPVTHCFWELPSLGSVLLGGQLIQFNLHEQQTNKQNKQQQIWTLIEHLLAMISKGILALACVHPLIQRMHGILITLKYWCTNCMYIQHVYSEYKKALHKENKAIKRKRNGKNAIAAVNSFPLCNWASLHFNIIPLKTELWWVQPSPTVLHTYPS